MLALVIPGIDGIRRSRGAWFECREWWQAGGAHGGTRDCALHYNALHSKMGDKDVSLPTRMVLSSFAGMGAAIFCHPLDTVR